MTSRYESRCRISADIRTCKGHGKKKVLTGIQESYTQDHIHCMSVFVVPDWLHPHQDQEDLLLPLSSLCGTSSALAKQHLGDLYSCRHFLSLPSEQ